MNKIYCKNCRHHLGCLCARNMKVKSKDSVTGEYYFSYDDLESNKNNDCKYFEDKDKYDIPNPLLFGFISGFVANNINRFFITSHVQSVLFYTIHISLSLLILFSIFFIDYRYSTFGHRNKKAIKEYEKKH